MTVNEIINRLDNVKGSAATGWTASCPCGRHEHGDKKPSLSIKYDQKTGKIIMKCHKDGTIDEICAGLGITVADLMPEPSKADKRAGYIEWYANKNDLTVGAVYSYEYGPFRDGLAKIRFYEKDGDKTFRWIRNAPEEKSGFKLNRGDCAHRLYIRGDLAADTVYLVEGEKDADNLHRLTGITTASAENGATKSTSGGSKWFPEYTEQLQGKTVYIFGDNDATGRDFVRLEAAAIAGKAKIVYTLDLAETWEDCPRKGDVSDMIKQLGDAKAKQYIQLMVLNAQEWSAADQSEPVPDQTELTPDQTEPAGDQSEQPRKSSVELFDDFMQNIQTEIYKPIKTGMQSFDYLLGGGIPSQSLVILSAAPGAGKTSFAQQIFEAMAATGRNVVFFNLEMARDQLLARSLSRIAYRQGNKGITATDIMRGYLWTDKQREIVNAAAAEYRRTIAERMLYNPEGAGTDVDSIIDTLEIIGENAKKNGQDAPVVVLDYLHLITTERREEQPEIIKKAIAALKRYAIKYNTFVFAISANNRAANSSGITTLESGRDTSAIEYSADIQLSLNYAALAEQRKKPGTGEIFRASNPDDMAILQDGDRNGNREMVVQVLKARLSKPGVKLHLAFNAAASAFTPIDQYAVPAAQPAPDPGEQMIL